MVNTKKRTYKLFCFFIVMALMCCIADVQAQCAMCKAAAESDLKNDPHSIAKGLNKGILFLMAFPYLVVGIIFRKELMQWILSLRGRAKQPFSKERLQWLRFALTFASILLILFLLFLNTQYQ